LLRSLSKGADIIGTTADFTGKRGISDDEQTTPNKNRQSARRRCAMAFDMYLGSRHESIGYHEEYIFSLMESDRDNFPELRAIQSNFYADFTLSPIQANALIHELFQLLEAASTDKALQLLVMRLASFFSAAVRSNSNIRCCGD